MNNTYSVINLKKPKYKLAVFDMDGTMFYETIFDDVFDIVKNFKRLNINMAVASYNPCAKWLCDRYDITQYFDIICGYDGDGKMKHMNEIQLHYHKKGINFDENEIIFFDDDIENFNDIQKLTKIRCVPVNPKRGITKDVIDLIF